MQHTHTPPTVNMTFWWQLSRRCGDSAGSKSAAMPAKGTYHYKITKGGEGVQGTPFGEMADDLPECTAGVLQPLEPCRAAILCVAEHGVRAVGVGHAGWREGAGMGHARVACQAQQVSGVLG